MFIRKVLFNNLNTLNSLIEVCLTDKKIKGFSINATNV